MAEAAPNVDDRTKALLETLWNDGKLGSAVRAKAKELYPDVMLPEDSLSPMVEPLRAELEANRKALEEMRAEREAEKAAALESSQRVNLETALANARQSYSLTDEGFDKMVERMKTTGNYSDADAAAAWVAQQTPVNKVSKADWLPKKMNFLGSGDINDNPDFKLLHTNPDRYLDKQLEQFVADPDTYVAETFAA